VPAGSAARLAIADALTKATARRGGRRIFMLIVALAFVLGGFSVDRADARSSKGPPHYGRSSKAMNGRKAGI
jgi:hypothetical protein